MEINVLTAVLLKFLAMVCVCVCVCKEDKSQIFFPVQGTDTDTLAVQCLATVSYMDMIIVVCINYAVQPLPCATKDSTTRPPEQLNWHHVENDHLLHDHLVHVILTKNKCYSTEPRTLILRSR